MIISANPGKGPPPVSDLHSDDDLFDRGVSDMRRGRALYPNQGLHEAAVSFAGCHARAIQYLEQAPVLVIGGIPAGVRFQRQNSLYIQHKIVPLCERGAPLKEVMAAFNLPLPMRRIRPFALFPTVGPTLYAIAKNVTPAVLGQIIPEKPGAQRKWLTAVHRWRTHLLRRRRSPDTYVGWVARASALAGIGPDLVETVADFASQPNERFNEAWKWPRAQEEADLWHGRLTAERALRGTPFQPDTVLDLGTHPEIADHDGYTFIALRTPTAICEEGAVMRHCVATYLNAVASGRSHIVSIQHGGLRVATLELDSSWRRVQCKGRANSQPRGDVLTAADHYAFDIRKAASQPSARSA